jgi:hypothetical protein
VGEPGVALGAGAWSVMLSEDVVMNSILSKVVWEGREVDVVFTCIL